MGFLETMNGYPVLLSYLIIFLAAFLETAPFIGLFIPGQFVVIIGGVAVHQGWLDFYAVFLLASLGAVLGDFLGYHLGRRYGEPFFRKKRKLFLLEHLPYEEAKKYFKKYGGLTILLGRFYSVTRAFTPFIAGTVKMKRSIFGFYNVLGGVLWGFTFTLLGYLFGEAYPLLEKMLGRILLAVLALAILIWLGYKTYKKYAVQG